MSFGSSLPLSSSSSSQPDDLGRAAPQVHVVMLPERVRGVPLLEGTELGPSVVLAFERGLRGSWSSIPGISAEVRCQHIRDHLGELPRRELDCCPEETTRDPDAIFSVLHSAFGDRREWGEMLHHFTGLRQHHDETVRLFSHRVMSSWDTLQHAQQHRRCKVVDNCLLVHVFVGGLADSLIQSFLREDLFVNSSLTFSTLREKAIRMEVPRKSEPPAPVNSVLSLVCERLEKLGESFLPLTTSDGERSRRRRRRTRQRRRARLGRLSSTADVKTVTVQVEDDRMGELYGERGEVMRELKRTGCEVNVPKREGVRWEGRRRVELTGRLAEVDSAMMFLNSLGIDLF